MKTLRTLILSLIFLAKSSVSVCQDTTTYFNSGNGEQLSELKLQTNKTFSETFIDWHGGFGGTHTGTYSWNNQILTLKYEESEQASFFFDSTKLFRIRELSSFQTSSNFSTKFIKIFVDSSLTKYSQPVRQSWSSWTLGKYENFDAEVNDFKESNFFKQESNTHKQPTKR